MQWAINSRRFVAGVFFRLEQKSVSEFKNIRDLKNWENAKSEMSRGYLKYPVTVKGSSTAVRDYYWSEIWSVGYQEHLLGRGWNRHVGWRHWCDVINVTESRQCHGGPVGKRLKSLQVTDDLNQSWPKPSENQSEGRYDGASDNESDGDSEIESDGNINRRKLNFSYGTG